MGLFSHEGTQNNVETSEDELYKKALSELTESMKRGASDYSTPGALLLHHDFQEQNQKLDKIIELLESK